MTSKSIYSQLIKLQEVVLRQQIPFVSYRLPLEEKVVTLVQHHSFPDKVKDINGLTHKQGFVVAPFRQTDACATWFLSPDCVFIGNEIDDVYIDKLAANNRFLNQIAAKCELQTTSFEEYTTNVAQAIHAINNAEFHKVVLSKVRVEKLPLDFSAADFFHKLCEKYLHALVYLIQIPEVGCWVGATPEPLMVIEDGLVKTVSLAGTQVATDVDIDAYRWGDKEIEEQFIVTDFVEKTLKSLGVSDLNKQGPENYRAANLIHLKTAFEFPESVLNGRLNDFVSSLHPTPSVGGLPKDEAGAFIRTHEQHPRSYYSGFLGPINIYGKTDLFVNLRCMQLFDKQYVLYSGAGITSSSEPEKEWVETDNKMLTMMNVMMSSTPQEELNDNQSMTKL